MQKIDPAELVGKGYAEARDWERDFGRAYGWPNLILAVAFFAGLVLALRGQVNTGGLIALTSFIIMLVLWCFFRHSRPVSPITGKRLTPYLSASPTPRDPDHPDTSPIVEMIYVDHDSKKYFRHAFLENEPTGSG